MIKINPEWRPHVDEHGVSRSRAVRSRTASRKLIRHRVPPQSCSVVLNRHLQQCPWWSALNVSFSDAQRGSNFLGSPGHLMASGWCRLDCQTSSCFQKHASLKVPVVQFQGFVIWGTDYREGWWCGAKTTGAWSVNCTKQPTIRLKSSFALTQSTSSERGDSRVLQESQ